MLKGTISKLLQGRFVMGSRFQYMMPQIAFSTTSCQHSMNATENIAKIGDFGNEVLFSDSSLLSPRNGRSVFIKSFGCSHNMSDGEYMAGLLHQGGYTITTHKEDADLWYMYRVLASIGLSTHVLFETNQFIVLSATIKKQNN